ncbi:hypothetical protein AB0883_14925 [Micromonospora sp. NPDC047812]|uniref:hypothetical protein n=1 Tax=Micromonospora sp. NPDC047812 TaxID=3155742 RepID=UPI00345221B4
MLAWGGTPFGALIGGPAADTYRVRVAYLMLAVPVVISLVLVVASPVRGPRIAVDQPGTPRANQVTAWSASGPHPAGQRPARRRRRRGSAFPALLPLSGPVGRR